MAKTWSKKVDRFHDAMEEEPDLVRCILSANQLKASLSWPWHDAPDALRIFNEGGDEELVVLVPPSVDEQPEFLRRVDWESKSQHGTKYGTVYVTHH